MKFLDFFEGIFTQPAGIKLDEKIISAIRREFDKKGYQFFDSDSKPYDVNVIGLRRLPKVAPFSGIGMGK